MSFSDRFSGDGDPTSGSDVSGSEYSPGSEELAELEEDEKFSRRAFGIARDPPAALHAASTGFTGPQAASASRRREVYSDWEEEDYVSEFDPGDSAGDDGEGDATGDGTDDGAGSMQGGVTAG
jgi:hypothetical protein